MEEMCPECGAKMIYDSTRHYTCTRCGIFLSREQLDTLSRKDNKRIDEKIIRRNRNDEYLNWWLSNKKKS